MKTGCGGMIKVLIAAAMGIVLSASLTPTAAQDSDNLTTVELPFVTLDAGDTTTLNADIACAVPDGCSAFDITVRYDPSVIRADALAVGQYLGDLVFIAQNEIDNDTGEIRLAVAVMGAMPEPESTILFSVDVTALAAGDSRLIVTHLDVADAVGNPVAAEGIDGGVIVNAPEPTIEPTQAEPTRTPTPMPGPTVTPLPPDAERVNILAYCENRSASPPQVTTADHIFVEWGWFVADEAYMAQHLEHAHYEVRLDGDLLGGWQDYASDMTFEDGVFIVYWYYPVGQLAAGEHTTEYRLTWDEAISDGYTEFGPGTENESEEGSCTFMVTPGETAAPSPAPSRRASISDIEAIMPAKTDVGLGGLPLELNTFNSTTRTLSQLVTLLDSAGLVQLAAITAEAGEKHGFIAQVVRAWDSGGACPGFGVYEFQVLVVLFETDLGARSHLFDFDMYEAQQNAGAFDEFEFSEDGVLAVGHSSNACGMVETYTKIVPNGRFQIATLMTVRADMDSEEVLGRLNATNRLMVERIEVAGLE